MTRAHAASFMHTIAPLCRDEAGELQLILLAQAAALHFEHYEWLDDERHWIWELAVRVGDEYEREERARCEAEVWALPDSQAVSSTRFRERVALRMTARDAQLKPRA